MPRQFVFKKIDTDQRFAVLFRTMNETRINESRTRVLAISEALYRVTAIPQFDPELSRALRAGALSLALAVLETKSPETIHRESNIIIDLITLGIRTNQISTTNGQKIATACHALQGESSSLATERVKKENSIEEREKTGMEDLEVRGDAMSRQQKIAAFIQSEGRARISQIHKLFMEVCSEKTIQRDLADLVEKGILRREGDHRWTTYIAVSDIGETIEDRA
jgi:hypothetical protein